MPPHRPLPIRLALATAATLATIGAAATISAAPGAQEVDAIAAALEDLGAPDLAARSRGEASLAELAQSSGDAAQRVLDRLPPPSDAIPADVQQAIERTRLRIQRAVAQRATAPTRVTLELTQAPLAEALDAFSSKASVRLVAEGAPEGQLVTVRLNDEPFWEALDKLLDEAGLTVDRLDTQGALRLRPSGPQERRRSGVAHYAGPFRFEPTSVVARRNLRDPTASRLDLGVEATWEPRLAPIALSQPMAGVTATTDVGGELTPTLPDQSIDLEVSPGQAALDLTLPLTLPPAGAKRLQSLDGELTAILPATRHEFRFEGLGERSLPATQRFGAATVTVERFAKAGAVWELHLRLRLDDAGDSLASHRGWVFQNPSRLQTAEGEFLEHIGYETTLQRADEVGIAYLFDLTGSDQNRPKEYDPAQLIWVYETPAGVYTVPVRWRLGPIDLP